MRHIRYFITLASDDDQIRVNFETDRGEVVALHAVQYETRVEGQWLPVARYDMAHGFFHLDLYTVRGAVKYRILVQDLSQALTFAIDDLKLNWLAYKHGFRGGESC
jgi:hypothetical protein